MGGKRRPPPLVEHHALTDSIEHWERMLHGVHGLNEEPGIKDCACCLSWFKPSTCQGCPIARYTTVQKCNNTPYVEAHRAYTDFGIDSPEFKKHARMEITFLRKVRNSL